MNEDRIDDLIDYPAIEAVITKVEARLGDLAATLKTMPTAKIQLTDASNSKELNDALKQQKIDLNDLKIKNAELTAAIKERNLAAKEAATQAKIQAQAAKEQAAAEKEAAKNAQIAGQERLRQLAAEKKAQQDIADAETKRNEAEQKALSGTYTAGSSAPKQTTAQYTPSNQTDALAYSLLQDQRQLAATKEAQKLLTAEFTAGNVSQAEYDAQLVKSIQLQNDLKVSIANTTKELSLQAKSNASIPGTIEALQTRNAVLSQQASQINVVNASPEEVAQLKTLNNEIDKNNELIRVNKDLLAQQKINIGNYPTALGQTFKTLNTELETVQGKLVSGNFGGKEVDQLTAKQTVLQNALSLTGKTFKSSAAEASAYKEAALQIGQVYGKDSSIFKQFADGVKQGAANTAALASEVVGAATKGKAFSGFLTTAYNGLRKVANVLPGIGISGLILLLVGPLEALGSMLIKTSKAATGLGVSFEDLQKRTQDIEADIHETSKQFEDAVTNVNELKINIDLAKKGFLDKNEVLKEYNSTLGKSLGAVKSLDQAEQAITKNGDAYIQMMLLKAAANVALESAAKHAFEAEENRRKALQDFAAPTQDAIGFNNFGTPTEAEQIAQGKKEQAAAKKRKDDAVKAAEDAKNEQLDIAKKFQQDAASIAKQINADLFGGTETTKIKKSHDDSQKLLDEYRKKDLDSLSKYSNDQLKIIQDQNKKMASDEQLSLKERLDYEQKYYDASLKLLENEKKTQIDALNLEADTALKNAKKIKDPKLRAQTDVAIEKYRTDQLKVIDETFADSTLKLNENLYTDNVQIATQSFDKLKKIEEDHAKFAQEQQKIAFQNQKDTVDVDKDNQLLQLEKDYQNGSIKSLEEYTQKKEAINEAADIKQKQLDLKRIQDAEKVTEILWGVKNYNFIKQAKDLEVQIEEEGNKKILDSKKELVEKQKDFAKDLADFIQAGLLAENQKQQDQLEKQSQNIDDKSQKEIDAINASTLAEADKQKKITAIEKQAAFEHQQIQQRQDQLDRQQKVIQRIAEVAEVGADIAKSVFDIQAKAAAARAEAALLAANPVTAFYAPIAFAAAATISSQIPFVLASGALALVKAAAFKDGTQNAPKGPALVSEEGPELLVDRHGKMFLTPSKPTLLDLAGGEKIFPHDQTEKILSHYNLLNIIQKAQAAKQPQRIDSFNEKIYRELRKLNSKPVHATYVQNGMETTDYYMRNIKN